MVLRHGFPEENATFLDLDVELLESVLAGLEEASV